MSSKTPEQPGLPGSAYLTYLRAWRVHRGMGVRELGEKAGVGKTAIVELEAQRRKASAATYGKLALALGIKPSLLLYIDPEDLPEETGAA